MFSIVVLVNRLKRLITIRLIFMLLVNPALHLRKEYT